jgi:hypothetical protein
VKSAVPSAEISWQQGGGLLVLRLPFKIQQTRGLLRETCQAAISNSHFGRLYSNDVQLLAACPSVHLKGINPIAPSIDS